MDLCYSVSADLCYYKNIEKQALALTQETFLTDIIIILLAAVIIVSGFRRAKFSSIVGYLIAGLAIGPYAFALIDNVHTISVLAEFGVVFLLFAIGLKMPIKRLQVLSKYVFGLGFSQVVLTTILLMVFCIAIFNLRLEAALVVASALALSSTAVGLQLLTEQGELGKQHGHVSFSILLAQDLAVVVLLVLLTTISKPNQGVFIALRDAGFNALIVLISIMLLGRLVLRPIFHAIAPLKNPEILTAVSILIVLLTSLATDAVGLSKELGAFVAGLLISETEYRHQVEADIQPFYGLLLGLFFMTIGMKINLGLVVSSGFTIIILLVGMLILKVGTIFGLSRLFKLPSTCSIKSSFLLASGGEFAFVLLGPAVEQKILHESAAQVIFVTVAISMGLTPLFVSMGNKLVAKLSKKQGSNIIASEIKGVDDLKNHVIIAGFGRVGNLLARFLSERVIPFVILDNNMERVQEGRTLGYPIFYGDATRDVVWKSLGAEKAISCVIGLTDQKNTLRSALMVRRHFPNIKISSRVADEAYLEKLREAEVYVVKPENLELGLKLASEILLSIGTNSNEVAQIIESFRRDHINRPNLTDQKSALSGADY